jgi:hypothetical protein
MPISSASHNQGGWGLRSVTNSRFRSVPSIIRKTHNTGDERYWWAEHKIDPLVAAAHLWRESQQLRAPPTVDHARSRNGTACGRLVCDRRGQRHLWLAWDPQRSTCVSLTFRTWHPGAPCFQVLDGHASDERPGTSKKSSGLKVTKVARCTRA